MKSFSCFWTSCLAFVMFACGSKTRGDVPVTDSVEAAQKITAIVHEIYAGPSSRNSGADGPAGNGKGNLESMRELSYADIVEKYGSDAFKKALKTCGEHTPEGELGPIDYDFFIQGQDCADDFSARVVSVMTRDDEVEARLRIHNGGDKTIRLIFVKEDEGGGETYLLDNVIDEFADIKVLMMSNQ